MPKYTISQVAKSVTAGAVATIGAAAAAAGGPDLSILDFGQWAIAIGAGLTAFGGVFGVPNAASAPTVATAQADVARATEAVRVIEEQRDVFAQTATDLKGVLVSAATGLAGDVFEQVLRSAGR